MKKTTCCDEVVGAFSSEEGADCEIERLNKEHHNSTNPYFVNDEIEVDVLPVTKAPML